MTNITIRIATPKDFPAIASLIVRLNSDPETQCIHSGTGEGVESMIVEMEKWHDSGEILFVIALENEQPIGTMGCEFESDGKRGWLRGPFSTIHKQTILPAMYSQLRTALPTEICRLDSFLHIENRAGQAFYKQMGFEAKGHSHVYVAPRPDHAQKPIIVNGISCIPLGKPDWQNFASLHDLFFPKTYYNGEQIVEQLDDDHRVWVYVSEREVLGYIYAVIEPWAEEGYVEFLGVREDARARGIGGTLLTSALIWLFDEREMPQVGLTVSDENVNARGLYERVGFHLKYTGVNQRLEWE